VIAFCPYYCTRTTALRSVITVTYPSVARLAETKRILHDTKQSTCICFSQSLETLIITITIITINTIIIEKDVYNVYCLTL
jgi:hypothetical protein